ncbi:MAG: hypothetical protein LH468_12370 [Nocardioides sp.]|nr:hypothetical protein [Nocardioides sp.]
MAAETAIPAGLLESLRATLGQGRSGIEETAASAPAGIDAGELSAMLSSMLSRVADSAALVSDSLEAVSAQVSEVGAEFWNVDADVAGDYSGQVPRAD